MTIERLIGCSWREMRGYVLGCIKRYAWIVYFAILVLAPLSIFIALEWLPWPLWPVLALVTIVVMGSLMRGVAPRLCDSRIGRLPR